MVDQNTFMETVRAVAEVAKTSDKPLSREEIKSYLAELALSDEQEEMVIAYVQNPPDDGEEQQQTKETEKSDADAEGKPAHSLFFDMYVADVQGILPCTKQQEDALYARLAAGDASVVEQLSNQWLARILACAKERAEDTGELEDVIQEGNMALFLALHSLCGAKGQTDYRALLTDVIEQAMDDYLLTTAGENDIEQTMLAKTSLVYEAQKALAEELMRVPTTEELAAYTKLTQKELVDILALAKENGQ